MKRLLVSTSTLLFVLFLGAVFVFADEGQQEAPRSIHDAIVAGNIEHVQSLISKGADINERNMLSWTPLHTAVQRRQKAIAEVLIDKGANINAIDKFGKTPLYVAIETGQKDMAELLIAKGADVNAISGQGENALSLAQKRGDKEVVDLLLKHGAKEPPANWAEDQIYGLAEQPQGPVPTSAIMPGRPQASTVARSDPNALANILADPNAIIARIKAFEGLDKALMQVDGRSRYEVREWLEKRTDNRVELARAVDLQVRAEIRFIRDVAVEEKAKKTTAAIDALLSGRQKQVKVLIEDMEEEIKAQRPVRTIRGRSSSRYSTRGQGYSQEQPIRGRATPYYGGTRMQREGPIINRNESTRLQRPPGSSPLLQGQGSQTAMPDAAVKYDIDLDLWLQREPEGRIDLADAVHEQATGQIISIRKTAVAEKAKKTTTAIDGVLLDRQKRFDKLINVLEQEVADLQGRDYLPGQMGATGQQEPAQEYGQRRPQPRR